MRAWWVSGWVVSGVGCRGRHFAASRNASSFLVLIGFGAREVSILERLSAAHCDEGRVVTTETNERLHLGSCGRDEAGLAYLTTSSARKLAWTVAPPCSC